VSPAPIKLAYLLSHPIQYQSPLLRRIAAEPSIDLTVLYTSDFSVREYVDKGFGVAMQWDVPLLDGYRHKFLPRLRDAQDITALAPLNYGFWREFRAGGYDAVWIHGYATANSLMAMVAARLLGIPVLQRMDGTLIDRARSGMKLRVKSGVLAVLERLVAAVLPVGTLNAAYWRRYLPDTPQFLMPYAVDNADFAARTLAAAAGREAFRAELGLQAGRGVILFAGKLMERKRCIDLVEAYVRLSPDWVEGVAGSGVRLTEPQPYLLIAGDGELRSQLEARATELNWESVRFLGFQNQTQLPRLYDLCDVFCLPSVHEPWGLIVNEVMAAGRAVVVSDEVGCVPDLVRDGETGLIHRAGDVAGLAGCLRRIATEPGLAERMGRAGADLIRTWDFEADVRGLVAALDFVTGRTR
jgi:glycosyltransferase involved in cell wall biosynthesis